MKNCVSALTDAGKEGKAARKQLAAVGDTLTSIGTTLTATVTTAVVAAGTAAVTAAMDFEESMASVEALISTSSDNIEQDMADLEAAAIEASTGSLYSATDAAEAMYYMALAGWDTTEMMEGLEPVLNLATAAEMDLSDASDIVTDYLTAFGLTASDAEGFVDQLAYAMSNSNTDVEELGEAYKNVAATSTQLGYSLEDTTAALMVMANSGIKGGEAGTALSSIMTRLGNNTSGCTDMLEEYGIEVYDAEGNVQSLSSILEGMQDIWSDLTDEEKSNLAYVVAGKTAQSELMTLLGDSTGSFEEYAEGLESCSGSAEEMTDVISGTLSSQIEILQGDLENLAIVFGDMILPYVQSFVSWLTELVESLQSMDEEEREQILQYAAMAAAIGPVLIIIGKLIKTISKVSGVISSLSKAGGILKGVFAAIASPAGVVVAIIAAIVAVVAVFITHIDEVKAAISAMLEKNAPQIEALGEAFQGLVDTLTPILSFIVDVFVNGVLGAFESLVGSDGVTWIIEGITDIITGLQDTLQGLIDFITGVFTGDWKSAWNGISEFFTGIAETIAGLIETISGALQTVVDTIGGLFSGIGSTVLSTLGIDTGSTGDVVGANASGTSSWKGGLTSINESGGEIINLPSGSQIIPHDLSRNTETAASSNISIAKLADEIVVREDADIDRITDELVRKLKKAQPNAA